MLVSLPQDNAISYTSHSSHLSCSLLFSTTASQATNQNFTKSEKNSFRPFARAACQTQNPDIIWEIAYVESKFKQHIVAVNGKEILMNKEAFHFLRHGITENSNVDIGPLQINWKANGTHWHYKPEKFMDGKFSVEFLSTKILNTYVTSCHNAWIQCYHSKNKKLGAEYLANIKNARKKLRMLLSKFLLHSSAP